MKNSSAALAWLGCGLFLVVPARATAEIVVAESTEWVLATSDRVFVGKVTKVDKVLSQENEECDAVTVAISKTLKGPHTAQETFLLRPYISSSYAKRWMDEGIPLIFCLIKNDGKRVSVPPNKFAWLLRDDGNDPDAILLGKSKNVWTGCISVLTRDFEVLTEVDAILKFAEQAVKASAPGASPKSHTLGVPSNTAVYKKLWSLSTVFLVVPVDDKLEALGQAWCKSKSTHERTEGAKALKHFKNEKNIALLKTLLNDPNTAESTMHKTVPGKAVLELVYRKKWYYVRQAAFDSLRALGAKVEQPVLEELLEGRDVKD